MKRISHIFLLVIVLSTSACVFKEIPSNEYFSLRSAIVKGDVAGVHQAIKNGADPIGRAGSRYIPIHNAAYYGRNDIFDILVKYGADPNIRNNKGHTVLHKAAFGGKIDTVRFLIKKGVNVNARDKEKHTALHTAAAKGYKGIVLLLLNNGADRYARNFLGYTPLHRAVTGGIFSARYRSGRIEVVKLFLKMGMSVNISTKNGFTLLHTAALYSDVPMIEFLIANGADASLRNKRGKTPLGMAIYYYKKERSPVYRRKNLKAIQALKKYGAK